MNKEQLNRFWEKVDVRGQDDCWEWLGCKSGGGYGNFSINRKSYVASRVMYTLYFDKIPDGMFVSHKCDNPSCVNPNHLFIGTANDNNQDRSRKGRNNSKLTRADINEIRKLYNETDISQLSLAKTYNVDNALISLIIANKLWKDENYKRKIKPGKNKYLKRLTDQDILEIRQLYKSGIYNQTEISKIYNVSSSYICLVVNDKKRKI